MCCMIYYFYISTAISIEEAPTIVTQEQIFENIHLHKEVLGSVKQQPLGMRRKLKIVHQVTQFYFGIIVIIFILLTLERCWP